MKRSDEILGVESVHLVVCVVEVPADRCWGSEIECGQLVCAE